MTQPDPCDAQLFAARLVPHRSLDQSHFRVLMMVFGGAAFVSALPFVFLGAWPVMGFMGLDVALVYFAFRANYRAARAFEEVRVTPLEVSVAKVTQHGQRSEFFCHPAWVRLERQVHEEYGVERVSLVSRGRALEVASFLGPDAKARFAESLSGALAEARKGPRFS